MPPPAPALPEPLPAEPFALFTRWFEEAASLRAQPNPNAFTLATIDPATRGPSARIVLCKHIDAKAGFIVFHTNYLSRKGRALEANPTAAALFHWDHANRQARIDGPVTRAPTSESDAYFRTRPWISRVAAWASAQSEPIDGREALLDKFNAACRRFGIDPDKPPAPTANPEIPRPPHWGGFHLHARRVELWVAVEGRLHDRAEWTRDLKPIAKTTDGQGGFTAASPWRSTRLQP